jgi:hypothetical protein
MKKLGQTPALYRFTVPVFITTLENVEKMVAKAEGHARRCKIEMATLLSSRLYPDMFTLLQQLQYICFIPVDFARHFSAAKPPRVGYDETSLAELKKSLRQTIVYLRAIEPARFAGRDNEPLPLFFDESKGLPGEAHSTRLTLPDFFFHVAVAYSILRHNGVPLGKADFIGPLGARPLARKK